MDVCNRIFPGISLFWLMFFVPESARLLVKNKEVQKAIVMLTKKGGGFYADLSVSEINFFYRRRISKTLRVISA
jgi:hypothetical protein